MSGIGTRDPRDSGIGTRDPRDSGLRSERFTTSILLTLDDAARGNALGPSMIAALRDAILRAPEDPTIRAIVIEGKGAYFCAGGDLRALAAASADSGGYRSGEAGASAYADLLAIMLRSEIPIIARVHGPALGGGLGLVMASTFAIATEHATFGTPEIELGLFPMMLLPLLVRQIPRRRLMRMVTLNEQILSDEALRLGLVDMIVDEGSLSSMVFTYVDRIASRSRTALAAGLRAMSLQDAKPATTVLPELAEALESLAGTDDTQARIAAFLAERVSKRTNK